MRKTQVLFTLFGLICVVLVGMSDGNSAYATQIQTLQDAAGKALTVHVTMGKLDRYSPQIAIWTEDLEGNFLDTLYVTYKFAKQQWDGNWGQTADETFRISSIPYWMHKREAQGLASPTTNDPLPDAVTAASPANDFTLQTKANTDLVDVYVLLEVNVAFDENDTYPNKANDPLAMYNGQPAVVYRAKVNLNQAGSYEMSLLGHSSWTGQDGELSEDISTLTTALNLLEKVVVVVE